MIQTRLRFPTKKNRIRGNGLIVAVTLFLVWE
nr:MAG TPA: hypothetical protein [Caudoviricetes sp.]